MRTAFINQLTEEAIKNEKVFLIVGDLGFSVVEKYAERLPGQFLNAGVAEQNMAGIAAGLAMQDFIVFIYSIGNFPTLRCMEQIRYTIAYHNLNVKIVAVGGGFSYGPLGTSHHATEEIGMLRVIPNMTICAPGDPEETKCITRFSVNNYGPLYIRLGKAGEPLVHKENSLGNLSLGDIIPVISGSETAIFSTGAMLKYAVDFVKQHRLTASVYSFPFIKPLNKGQITILLNKYQQIITLEEHQKSGGFGSVILETANDLIEEKKLNKLPNIKRIAIPDKFYSISGSQKYLWEKAGLVLKEEYFK
jgi:transketolase